MRTIGLWVLVTMTLLTTGCREKVGLGDTVDLTFDWGWGRDSDSLHQPYVAGSSFHLYPTGVSEIDTTGWTVESDDPSIFSIVDTLDGDAEVVAQSEGVAEVSLVDEGGQARHRTRMDVRQADGAEVLAHGPEIIDWPELQEDWAEIQVLVGGGGTFLVHWYQGTTRLYGNGALGASAPAGIRVEVARTFLFEDRDWVTFWPEAAGVYDVELMANGLPVHQVRIIAVDEDAIDHVELHGMNESGASRGELLTVLARAYDTSSRPIFGAEFEWDLDGVVESDAGDLFRYEYAPGNERILGANYTSLALDASATIQADDGFVSSTHNKGCSAAGGGVPMPGWLPLLGLLLMMVGLRRRTVRAAMRG